MSEKHKMIKKLVLWIAIILCMTAIFLLSAQEASSSTETSSSFIKAIISIFDFRGKLSPSEISIIIKKTTNIVRKAAHFSIYSLLGFLVALLVSFYKIYGKKRLYITITAAFLYACSDELHQYFIKGRSAQLSDILLDTAGAFCGLLLTVICCRIYLKLKGKDLK